MLGGAAFALIVFLSLFAPAYPQKKVRILNNPKSQSEAKLSRFGLCREATAREGAQYIKTDATVEGFLGSPKKIKVHYYSKDWKSFTRVKAHLAQLLAAKPETLYQYEPWAEAVNISVIGTIEFENQRQGALEIGSGGRHLCFQDQTGKYWWARFSDGRTVLEN